MEELSRRAAATRGVAAGTISADGAAPVVVPRKVRSPDSPAVKELAEKQKEIASKIAQGSVASASQSMAVGMPSKIAAVGQNLKAVPKATAPKTPSIKERYATEGSSPATVKAEVSAPSTPARTAIPKEVAQAQTAVSAALKEASSALGQAIHIHVHAPVHIHIGESPKSKL